MNLMNEEINAIVQINEAKNNVQSGTFNASIEKSLIKKGLVERHLPEQSLLACLRLTDTGKMIVNEL